MLFILLSLTNKELCSLMKEVADEIIKRYIRSDIYHFFVLTIRKHTIRHINLFFVFFFRKIIINPKDIYVPNMCLYFWGTLGGYQTKTFIKWQYQINFCYLLILDNRHFSYSDYTNCYALVIPILLYLRQQRAFRILILVLLGDSASYTNNGLKLEFVLYSLYI